VGFSVINPGDLEWETRPSDPDSAERHVAALTELAGFKHTRANLWRYEPGARGRRHKDMLQEETFVVVSGVLSLYLDDPPERHDVAERGLVHVESGTPLQIVNHGTDDLVLYIYGAPPERGHAEFLDSAL
jgi:uncharacterized cupin superfamily protein